MSLAALASILGGSGIDFALSRSGTPSLGLDWFVLNVLLLAAVFVPMERIWPLRPAQSTFRPAWTTDTLYFLVSHLFVQVTTFLILAPAQAAFAAFDGQPWRAAIAGLPLVVQFFAVLLSADLAEYFIHRAFHVVPALWRFHAIHHSSIDMDWLAGSRLHIVDVIVTRAIVVFPLFALGFDQRAVAAYLVFVSFHAVLIHANVRFDLRRIERWVVTPRFHHWHHAKDRAAIDKNFAVHLPWIDRLFGTAYEPQGAWPERYGIEGDPVPPDLLPQTVWPLSRDRRD
jgi:sterol desaturase/sphingolipid hydroxylase (fatty acid hydroxylase superfamily)